MKHNQQDPYRYGENDSRPFFLNSKHYIDTYQILSKFMKSQEDHNENLTPTPTVPEENRRLPVSDYFSFYSDLLGFTNEVSRGGMDSLPDYFGGAFTAAYDYPKVSVYLLSDSCIATTPKEDDDDFWQFVSSIFSRWRSNGLIPQCSIGFGSFVERKAFHDRRPKNFFGTQISGTALSDAANHQKTARAPGSRIIVSEKALHNWPNDKVDYLAFDGTHTEFLPTRPWTYCLFDCVYFLLCLREHEPDSRAFQHYVWSFASTAIAGRDNRVREYAPRLARDCFANAYNHLVTAVRHIDDSLKMYQSP